MSAYTLDYLPHADDDLARIWTTAIDRAAVTHSANQIEKLLLSSPRKCGTEMGENLWKVEFGALAAYYHIDDQKRLVTVTGFALIDQPGNGQP